MSTVVQIGRAQNVTNKELYTGVQPKGNLLQEVIERTSEMFNCEFLILIIIITNINFISLIQVVGPQAANARTASAVGRPFEGQCLYPKTN